jgi:hypothetical protein
MTAREFYFGNLEFQVRAVTDLELPVYKGSTFRGAFGHALRRLSCHCQDFDGSAKHTCAYGYLMSTSTFHSSLTYAQNPPHPFILEPPDAHKQFYCSGAELSLKSILIGDSVNYLPYVLVAVQHMGQTGVGKGRGKFVLEHVESVNMENRAVIYSAEEQMLSTSIPRTAWQDVMNMALLLGEVDEITLRFITPYRLKHDGSLVDCDRFSFAVLIGNLLERVSRLGRYYCGLKERLDAHELRQLANSVMVADFDMQWYDWERYSRTQDTKMKLGGLLGSARFAGNITPFLPYLLLGSYIHVGKNTIFGLGKYEICPA